MVTFAKSLKNIAYPAGPALIRLCLIKIFQMSIEVSGLTKKYGEQVAVNNISFGISKGEIVGFLGPNGAGKSTTMKILTGYLRQDEGHALVCGINVRENPVEIKKRIGYLPEANPLYQDMYVREYLDFIAGVHGIPDRKKRMEDVLQTTGLLAESKKMISQLSRGYKQRTGLAAALIHDPEVLILDEPTSGLDPNQIIEIRDVIRALGQQKTVLFSSHILQEVEAICDRVIIINKGVLVADDTLGTLGKGSKGQHAVLVRFKEKTGITTLENMEGVTRAEELQESYFRLETNDPDHVKKQLFALALQHNLNIVSLQSESQSLEEVFRQLTSPGKP
jgi:ABC-2 type transport system ATP-binding protein